MCAFIPIPTPPLIWRAPVTVLVDSDVLFIITLPPVYTFPPIPTPPLIWSAPEFVLVDSILL